MKRWWGSRERIDPMTTGAKPDRDNHMAKGRTAALEVRRKRANARAAEVAPVIAGLRAVGLTSMHGIARALPERGIRIATGKGKWEAVQVRRVLARLQT